MLLQKPLEWLGVDVVTWLLLVGVCGRDPMRPTSRVHAGVVGGLGPLGAQLPLEVSVPALRLSPVDEEWGPV